MDPMSCTAPHKFRPYGGPQVHVTSGHFELHEQACLGYTNLRSSEYQKKLKSSGSFAPRTLTSFGFALTLPTDVGCFKFSARPFVRAHPHSVRVRADTLDRCSTLQVRARSFVSAHPLAASLLYMALRRAPSKCRAAAAGAARVRARPNPPMS
jgi:hypothetical protein